MERVTDRTPEMMNHIEVSDLGEEASHSFSVVLAVSNGPGPAHKNNFSHNAGQDTQRAWSGLTTAKIFDQPSKIPTSSSKLGNACLYAVVIIPGDLSSNHKMWHHFLS